MYAELDADGGVGTAGIAQLGGTGTCLPRSTEPSIW